MYNSSGTDNSYASPRPVIYLRVDLIITGNGAKDNPRILKNTSNYSEVFSI